MYSDWSVEREGTDDSNAFDRWSLYTLWYTERSYSIANTGAEVYAWLIDYSNGASSTSSCCRSAGRESPLYTHGDIILKKKQLIIKRPSTACVRVYYAAVLNRPHYGSWPSVRPSVRPSRTRSLLETKAGEKPKRVWTLNVEHYKSKLTVVPIRTFWAETKLGGRPHNMSTLQIDTLL